MCLQKVVHRATINRADPFLCRVFRILALKNLNRTWLILLILITCLRLLFNFAANDCSRLRRNVHFRNKF